MARSGIGFDSVQNAVTLCLPGGRTKSLPRQSKVEIAREIIRLIEQLAASR